MPVEITLSMWEIMQAAFVGAMRQVSALSLNRKSRYGEEGENDWQIHIEGALGEFAVAKYLGIFWNGTLGSIHLPDVVTYQVRTRSKHHYDLLVHDEDKDNDIFILVTGKNGNYVIRGWMVAKQAKNRDKYWKNVGNDRPAYFVPQSDINPIETLPKINKAIGEIK